MSAPARMLSLIERKKLGGEIEPADLAWLCHEYVAGGIPDYQVAAWLMAVRLRGMTDREASALTEALVASGRTLDWPDDRPVVDKHSTGGVGDKTSIVLVPLLAAAGVTFVKMSGRGLGHTGGTLDKLESIPGYRTDLSLEEIRVQVARIGCALVGQTPELVPADGALYALRDVTSTVDSVPLIASSVMSKKLAGGARSIVIDVKHGSGALLATKAEAEEVSRLMVGIGSRAGRRVRAVLTRMDEPLGMSVGNALEVREAIDVLTGGGPGDVRRLTVELGAHLMVMSGCTSSLDDARAGLNRLLDAGLGARHLEKLIEAQGGDPRIVEDPLRLPRAPIVRVVRSPADGWVERVDARAVADAALILGAGRQKKGDRIDPSTGVRLLVRSGEKVARGQPVCELHLASPSQESRAAEAVLGGTRIVPDEPSMRSDEEPSVIGT